MCMMTDEEIFSTTRRPMKKSIPFHRSCEKISTVNIKATVDMLDLEPPNLSYRGKRNPCNGTYSIISK